MVTKKRQVRLTRSAFNDQGQQIVICIRVYHVGAGFPHQRQLVQVFEHRLARDRLGELTSVDCWIIIRNATHHVEHLTQRDFVGMNVLRHKFREFVID